jgi:hypothetical protein
VGWQFRSSRIGEYAPSLVVCLAACQVWYRCVVGSAPAHPSNLTRLFQGKKSCHVRLKARPVVPIVSINSSDDAVIYLGSRERNPCTYPTWGGNGGLSGADERVGQLGAPQPPVKEVSTVSIKGIYLKKMALDVKVAALSANKGLTEEEVANETEYRASIVFSYRRQ